MSEQLVPVVINHTECQVVVSRLRAQRQLLLDERDQLLIEVDRLRTELRIRDEGVLRLGAALRRIQEWDCLNPPDPTLCADHPWLRRLVDEALL